MEFDDYESLPTADVKTIMMAGAMAGVMEHCIMYPLDSVKTRMQSLLPHPHARYKSIHEALTKMVRKEGILRPMKGMSAVVVGSGPAHALYFTCYEKMKRILRNTSHHGHHNIANGAAGCIATLFHDAVMTPADVIKQRMQMYNSPYRNCWQCIHQMYRKEGFRAFYRSYSTQLTMNLPFQSIHFIMYEYTQDFTNPHRVYNPAAHMISGGAAGAVAAAVTTPLDVCKTLLNTQEAGVVSRHGSQQAIVGLINAVKGIYRCCGIKGFFQGIRPRILFQVPSTAISWSVYEFFKYILSKKERDQPLPVGEPDNTLPESGGSYVQLHSSGGGSVHHYSGNGGVSVRTAIVPTS